MDWIETFLAYTEGVTSPKLFRQWSAISAVAGALERRVWVKTSRGVLYPNMYVMLVGGPGVGKGEAVKPVEDLWYSCSKLFIAPESTTKAALIDALREAERKIIYNEGRDIMDYHSLLFPVSEFGTLISSHDIEFLAVLNKLYDCGEVYRERRRHVNQGKDVEITRPCLNLLGGVQPGFLSSILPEEAWTQGFTARMLMIYSSTRPTVELFGDNDPRTALRDELGTQMTKMCDLMGVFHWDRDAMDTLSSWHRAGCPPVPDHAKLANYNPRRTLHVIKLTMVSAVSRSLSLHITRDDVIRAFDWLLEAESLMPDIFREMLQQSDAQAMYELHYFLWAIYNRDKRPIHKSFVMRFLAAKAPVQKHSGIIELAINCGLLEQISPELFVPKPKTGGDGLGPTI